MTAQAWQLYDLLLDRAASDSEVAEVILGATWVLCGAIPSPIEEAPHPTWGLAMGPPCRNRSLPWSGTLRGRPLRELQSWVRSWDPHEASVGMAAVNAGLGDGAPILGPGYRLDEAGPANLAVFHHFRPRLAGRKVVVVGRYPGLEPLERELGLTVLERSPGPSDLPDAAAEYVIPEADWVFLSASTITNKTFPRLAELARDANLVLMGPSVPWLIELAEFGVDFVAGVTVTIPQVLRATVAEGGGTRLFEEGVSYRVVDLRERAAARSEAHGGEQTSHC